MNRLLAFTSLVLFSLSAYASEPVADYGFTCATADSALKISGGVDPSGEADSAA